MAEKQDLKKHFESIIGRQIDPAQDGGIALREPVGISTFTLDGSLTSREIGTSGASTKTCRKARVFDVSGTARTGINGTEKFTLSDFFCGGFDEYRHPTNFVATPRSSLPIYITSAQAITVNGNDVTITVHTWDKSGVPAANIVFDWRCRVTGESNTVE